MIKLKPSVFATVESYLFPKPSNGVNRLRVSPPVIVEYWSGNDMLPQWTDGAGVSLHAGVVTVPASKNHPRKAINLAIILRVDSALRQNRSIALCPFSSLLNCCLVGTGIVLTIQNFSP